MIPTPTASRRAGTIPKLRKRKQSDSSLSHLRFPNQLHNMLLHLKITPDSNSTTCSCASNDPKTYHITTRTCASNVPKLKSSDMQRHLRRFPNELRHDAQLCPKALTFITFRTILRGPPQPRSGLAAARLEMFGIFRKVRNI